MDFNQNTYSVLAIDENVELLGPNYVMESGPWRYDSGGTLISEGNLMQYAAGLNDEQSGGHLGDYHYAVAVDLSFLPLGTEFISHFIMECGNGNLMGQGMAPVPEPATMLLFGSGILGFAGYTRRRGKA